MGLMVGILVGASRSRGAAAFFNVFGGIEWRITVCCPPGRPSSPHC